MDVRPIERLEVRQLNLHRIGVDVLDNLLLQVDVTELLGEQGHFLEPFDVTLIGRDKGLQKTGGDRLGGRHIPL